jgi:hypothetical protein
MYRSMRRLMAGAFACALASSAGAEPVEYVRVCTIYGAGFFYIPGTDTCLRVDGRLLDGRPAEPDFIANTGGWGWNAQGLVFAGDTDATSFGQDFSPHKLGWSVGAGLTLPNYIRLQADAKIETTGFYSPLAGRSSHVAYGGHLSWNAVSNFDFGPFGGFMDTNPLFGQLDSSYRFVGFEGRYFTRNWLIGVQAGQFDVSSGPGALTDAWFAEGRVRVSVGELFGKPADKLGIMGSFGHASGHLGTTTLNAESTQWNVGMSYKIAPSFTAFAGYHGFKNKVEDSVVWKEHMVKAGVKLDIGSPGAAVPIEPMLPLPSLISGAAYKF